MKRKALRWFVSIMLAALLLVGAASCVQNNDKQLVGINIRNLPQEAILIGSFDEAGIQFELIYDDGTSERIDVLEETIPEEYRHLLYEPGVHIMEFLYRGIEVAFSIEFRDYEYYQVRFLNALGQEVSIQNVREGLDATPPTAEEMEVEGYEWLGTFDLPYTNIQSNVDIRGEYIKIHTVRFLNALDEVVSTQYIRDGEDAVPPGEVEMFVEGYRFLGTFDRPYTAIKSDSDIKGEYVKTWKVTFFNGNSEVISEQIVDDGGSAVEPDESLRVMDGWIWVAWDSPFTDIRKDTKVYGLYTRAYTLTFMVDGEPYEIRTYAAGAEIEEIEDPFKANRKFAGWYDEIPDLMPAENLIIQGGFFYHINYILDGNYYDTVTVAYSKEVSPRPAPEIPEGLTFGGWQNEPSVMPAYDVAVYGECSSNEYRLTVKAYSEDENLYLEENVAEKTIRFGEEIVLPVFDIPEFTGYYFDRIGDFPSVMPANDVEVRLYYHQIEEEEHFLLTICYLFEDGTTAAAPYAGEYYSGQSYSVSSPEIKGYIPDLKTVEGIMPERDLTVKVFYFKSALVEYDGNGADGGTPPASSEVKVGDTIIVEDEKDLYKIFSKTGEYYREQLDVVLVIDTSGSMSWNDGQNKRIAAAKEFVDSLTEEDRAAIIDFDSTYKVLCNFTRSKEDLFQALDRLDSYGGTNLTMGISSAIDLFTAADYDGTTISGGKAQKLVIFLTDGLGSYQTTYTVKAYQEGITIFSIGLGRDADQEVLEAIAEGTLGEYYYIDDAEGLQSIYQKISDRVTYIYYEFLGWDVSDEEGSRGLFEPGDELLVNSNTKLVACWGTEFYCDLEHHGKGLQRRICPRRYPCLQVSDRL